MKTIEIMTGIVSKMDEMAMAEPVRIRKQTIAAIALKVRDLIAEALYLSIVENFELDEAGLQAMTRTLKETEKLYAGMCEYQAGVDHPATTSKGSSSAN